MNQYDPGSMGYVSIVQNLNGVKIVKGYYSYSHGKRGWVEAKFVNDRLSCLHYWDRTDCRAPGEGAGKQMERAAAEAAAIHGQLHRLHQNPHRRGCSDVTL